MLAARLKTAAWLGWQVESNWADPLVFGIYTVLRPLATALILAGMYWAVSSRAARAGLFPAVYLGNAFHVYVTTVVIGMGWVVVEEREEYETLKYVYTSPIGMFTYLTGRATVKLVLATLSLLLTLTVGWFLVRVHWSWTAVAWGPLALALVFGLAATVALGFLVAGMALLLPRVAISINEGLAVALYLLCGVIFPIDLLPHGLRELSLFLPFTWWYECLRRFILGAGVSTTLGTLPGAALLGGLAATTAAFVVLGVRGYSALERRARQAGRLDQTTMF
ncbi:MAG TPA: ABC transporter permease [Candidatus Eisenbacteria bacterium]